MARVERPILADVTNGTDGTYYYYFQAGGFDLTVLRGILSGGSGTCTVTLEATLTEAATATAAALLTDYVDVTNLVTGSASYTASFLKSCSNLLSVFSWVRVKVVASTGGANDADWKIAAGKFNSTAM
jgi:hypothetical protein